MQNGRDVINPFDTKSRSGLMAQMQQDLAGRDRNRYPERDGVNRPLKMKVLASRLPGVTDFSHLNSTINGVADGYKQENERLQGIYAASPDYLKKHPALNARVRAILFDWIVEVGQEYTLKRETIHFAFNYVDRYLSRYDSPVDRNDFQLVGITALWLASKMEEIIPPPVSSFALATDSGSTEEQIIAMENKMILILNWQTLPPTCYGWANYYLHTLFKTKRNVVNLSQFSSSSSQSSFDSSQESYTKEDPSFYVRASEVPTYCLNRVMEVIDVGMLDVENLKHSRAAIAASVLMCLIDRDTESEFTVSDIERVSGMSRPSLENCIEWIQYCLDVEPQSKAAHVHQARLENDIPAQDFNSVQRHNTEALKLVKEAIQIRAKDEIHPATAAYLQKKREASAVSVDMQDDDEFQMMQQANYSRETGERLGALSPATDLSFGLGSLGFTNKQRMHENHGS